jgi:hypothetical protein
VVGAIPADRVVKVIGAKLTAASGFVLLAVGLFVGATTSVGSSTVFVAVWMAIVGMGMGLSNLAATPGSTSTPVCASRRSRRTSRVATSRSRFSSDTVRIIPEIHCNHSAARGPVRSSSTPSGIWTLLMKRWMSASEPGAGVRGSGSLISLRPCSRLACYQRTRLAGALLLEFCTLQGAMSGSQGLATKQRRPALSSAQADTRNGYVLRHTWLRRRVPSRSKHWCRGRNSMRCRSLLRSRPGPHP